MTMAGPSAVGESGHLRRRDRSPTRTPIRADQIRDVLMEELAGEERSHAGRHVVPRDDGAVYVRRVKPDEHGDGIGRGEHAVPRQRPKRGGRSRLVPLRWRGSV